MSQYETNARGESIGPFTVATVYDQRDAERICRLLNEDDRP